MMTEAKTSGGAEVVGTPPTMAVPDAPMIQSGDIVGLDFAEAEARAVVNDMEEAEAIAAASCDGDFIRLREQKRVIGMLNVAAKYVRDAGRPVTINSIKAHMDKLGYGSTPGYQYPTGFFFLLKRLAIFTVKRRSNKTYYSIANPDLLPITSDTKFR